MMSNFQSLISGINGVMLAARRSDFRRTKPQASFFKFRDSSSVGRAAVFQTACRRFKSGLSLQACSLIDGLAERLIRHSDTHGLCGLEHLGRRRYNPGKSSGESRLRRLRISLNPSFINQRQIPVWLARILPASVGKRARVICENVTAMQKAFAIVARNGLGTYFLNRIMLVQVQPIAPILRWETDCVVASVRWSEFIPCEVNT